jgi:hypothetical protein
MAKKIFSLVSNTSPRVGLDPAKKKHKENKNKPVFLQDFVVVCPLRELKKKNFLFILCISIMHNNIFGSI